MRADHHWKTAGRKQRSSLYPALPRLALAAIFLLAACSSRGRSLDPTAVPAGATSTPPAQNTLISPTPAPTALPAQTPTLLFPTETPVPQLTSLPSVIRYQPWEIVTSIAMAPDGKVLAVAAGPTIYLYEPATRVEMNRLKAGQSPSRLAFQPTSSGSSRLLAAAFRDGTVQIWDTTEGNLTCTFEAHRNAANSLAFSPDGHWLGTSGNDGMVRLWEITGQGGEVACPEKPGAEMIGGAFAVPDVAFSPDGTLVAALDARVIRLREVSSQRLALTISPETSLFSLSFSPDGKLIASGEISGTVQLWDTTSGSLVTTGRLGSASRKNPGVFVWSLAFDPKGRWLAGGANDGSLAVWEVDPAKPILAIMKSWLGHQKAITSVLFTPDGLTLISASLDGSVQFWPVEK